MFNEDSGSDDRGELIKVLDKPVPDPSLRLSQIRERCEKATAKIDDENRCAVCGWPLSTSPLQGCTRGNCSQRPFPVFLYAPERANREYNGRLCEGSYASAFDCPVHRPRPDRIDPDVPYLLDLVSDLIRREQALREENERLKAGKFTKDEIHDICHNLYGTVSAEAFADGCAAEQIKLYGQAPDRDRADALRAENEQLKAELQVARLASHPLAEHGDLPRPATGPSEG